jgi:ribonuclease HII
VVCGVAVPRLWTDATVTDSKALTEGARREIVRRYRTSPDVIRVVHRTSPREIDEHGVWAAVIFAHNYVHQALEAKLVAVHPGVTFVHIVDGFENAGLKLDARINALAKADTFVPAVSLASCFAKVVQCELMRRAGDLYPGYGFERHKGYGTESHRKALAALGVVDIHRKSYRPIRELMNGVSSDCRR